MASINWKQTSAGIILVVLVAFSVMFQFDQDGETTLKKDGEILAKYKWTVNAERTWKLMKYSYQEDACLKAGGTLRTYDSGDTRCYYPDDYYEMLSRSRLNTELYTDNVTVFRDTPFFRYGTTGTYAGWLRERSKFEDTDNIEEFPKESTVWWEPEDTRNYILEWRIYDIKDQSYNDGTYSQCDWKFGNVKVNLPECDYTVIEGDTATIYMPAARGEQYLEPLFVDPLDTDLEAYLKLESDGSDETANNNDGTNNGATFAAAQIGNGADFDWTQDDYIEIPADDSLDGMSALTASGWLKLTDLDGSATDARVWHQNSVWSLSVNYGDGEIRWRVYDSSTTYELNPSGTGMYDPCWGKWCYVTTSYNGATGNLSMTVNGTEYSVVQATISGNVDDDTNPVHLFIDEDESTRSCDGMLDEFAVWSRVLTSAEVAELVAGATPYDTPDSKTLYVDQDSIGGACNDGYTRAENDITHPWCDLDMIVSDALGGDLVYIRAGAYNDAIKFDGDDYTDQLVIAGYPGEEVNWSYYYDGPASTPNTCWDDMSHGNVNLWRLEDGDCGINSYDTYTLVTYANGTIFYPYEELSYLNSTTHGTGFDGSYSDPGSDTLYIRFNDTSKNPNNIPLFVNGEYGTINIDDSENIKIANITFIYNRYAIYAEGGSNTLDFEGLNIIGTLRGIFVKNAGEPHSISLYDSNIHCSIKDSDYLYWYYVKDYHYLSRMEGAGIYYEECDYNCHVQNNNISGFFNGIFVGTGDTNRRYDNSVISGNRVWNIFDDGIELEDYYTNVSILNNTVYDAFTALSLAYADCSDQCYAQYNKLEASKRIQVEPGTTWGGKVYKLDRGDTSNWLIDHNTGYANVPSQTDYGLRCEDAGGNLANSNFTNNIMYVEGGWVYDRTDTSANGNWYDYNLLYDNSDSDIGRYWNDNSDSTAMTLAEFLTADSSGWEENSIQADPAFISTDPSNITYYLVPVNTSDACGAASDGSDIGAEPCQEAPAEPEPEPEPWSCAEFNYSCGHVLNYTFDPEVAGIAVDSSGQGNNGTFVNNAMYTNFGSIQKGSKFKDNADKITAPHIDFDASTSEFTVCMWFFPTVYGTGDTIIEQRDGNDDGWRLSFHNTDYAVYASIDEDDEVVKGFSINNWNNVCAVFDLDNNISIYKNGILGGTPSVITQTMSTTANIIIGSDYDDDYGYTGIIDEVNIWNRSLTAAEVADLYGRQYNASCDAPEDWAYNPPDLISRWNFDNSTPTDFITGDIDPTPDANWTADGRFGGAFDFNTEGQDINIGTHDAGTLRQMTYSLWIKPRTLNIGVGLIGNSGGQDRVNLLVTSDGAVYVQFRNGTSSTQGVDTDWIPPTDEWTHLLVSFDALNNNMSFFANGEPIYEYSSQTWATANMIDLARYVGYDGWNPTPKTFNGTIDEVQIRAKATTAEEARAIYKAGSHYEGPWSMWHNCTITEDAELDGSGIYMGCGEDAIFTIDANITNAGDIQMTNYGTGSQCTRALIGGKLGQ